MVVRQLALCCFKSTVRVAGSCQHSSSFLNHDRSVRSSTSHHNTLGRTFTSQSKGDQSSAKGQSKFVYPDPSIYKQKSRFNNFSFWTMMGTVVTLPVVFLCYLYYARDSDEYEWIEVEGPRNKYYSLEPRKKMVRVKKAKSIAVSDTSGYRPPERRNSILPDHVPYLIIGTGTAALSAFRAIKSADIDAKILLIGEETHLPYMRPPLSKELWGGDEKMRRSLDYTGFNGKIKNVFYEKNEFFCYPDELDQKPHGGVSLALGRKVVKLDPTGHVAVLEDGTKIRFDKCLIATGGKPKLPKAIDEASDELKQRMILYRGIDDFQKLDKQIQKTDTIAIVGGGFLGSELACSLARHTRDMGCKVVQVFPESGNLGKVLPEYLSRHTTKLVSSEGVNVISNAGIEQTYLLNGQLKVFLTNDEMINADHVIVAVGIQPDVNLAQNAGLEVDQNNGGFLCDSELRARTDVWVAGDCCSFYDPKLGRRRIEHQEHATASGRLAGLNMTGAGKAYNHQSMFWSDLSPKIGFEAIGLVDSSLQTVGIFAKMENENKVDAALADQVVESQENIEKRNGDDLSKGVVFYLKGKQIVGMLFWNLYGRTSIARRILKENTEYEDLNEVAKLFNIHDAPPVGFSEKEDEKHAQEKEVGNI